MATHFKGDKSFTKHNKLAKKYKKLITKEQHKSDRAESEIINCLNKAQKTDKKHAAKWKKQQKKWTKTRNSAQAAERRYRKKYKKQSKYTKKHAASNKRSVANKIAQKGDWDNEGKCAIYRTDGHSSNVVFISPSDTESESRDAEVTSYPVDKGAPRSNYVRNTGDTKSVAGIISGDDRADANRKYAQLIYWYHHNTDLTYVGDISSDHLFITNISNTFSDLRDNLKVSITFTYVRSADVTKKSTGNNSKAKKSKSSKTTRGSRNKRYTAITIKPGDTLLGLSRKYGKSVAWLQKVNKIKNPNKIVAGNKLYVKQRVHERSGGKMIVKSVYKMSTNSDKKVRVR